MILVVLENKPEHEQDKIVETLLLLLLFKKNIPD